MLPWCKQKDSKSLALFRDSIKRKFRKLLSPFGLVNGKRCELLVCEECEEIGCGLISIKITETSDQIQWKEFCFQTSAEEMEDLHLLSGLNFSFDKSQYLHEMKECRDEILNFKSE